jgi:sugar phosphate permease
VGGGFCFVGCIRVAANWYPDHRIALASGFIVSMGMLGGFVVQAPLSYLIDLYDWRAATLIVSLMGCVVTLLIFLFVEDRPKGVKFERRCIDLSELFTAMKQVFRNPQNWWCALYAGTINLPISLLGSLWGIPYLVHVYHLSELDAAHVCGLIFIGAMVGSLLVNAISNVLRSRKLPMLIGVMLALALLLYTTAFMDSPSVTELAWFFFILGVVTSTQVIAYPTVIESNPAALSSTATSIISIMCLTGGAISSPLFGYLLMHFNTMESVPYKVVDPIAYETAIYMLPIALLITLLSVFFIQESFGTSDKKKAKKSKRARKG